MPESADIHASKAVRGSCHWARTHLVITFTRKWKFQDNKRRKALYCIDKDAEQYSVTLLDPALFLSLSSPDPGSGAAHLSHRGPKWVLS